jgi:ABC-type branched-subunit amino acid transport system ATPase component
LLDVRNIDFSYGQVQILFDVSLTVQPGEFVALLGTNGAGKSTLLRVISGQGLPQRGTVYFGGVDVTSLNAVRRVPLGMSQIPGGKAVFGPLTVAENLDLFSESASETPEARAQAIEQAYTTFPRLAERRTQAAETLSGGEQQMLALAKALMTSPRLLCIDELSLGLAPAVVAELLEILRSIHASGTTIVLVEQSLNVALAIADRAVFMEKGEVRYDGPADELRNRDDLLRSVFFAAESGGL